MDPRLLRYYESELKYIREMGGEFAREFPKIAGRLGLEEFECADPYVERLLESFAFMAARVHLKIDAEFPRFSQHLLEIVYPHYLAPTPSMAVVQLSPNLNEGALAAGFRVPRGTALRGLLGRQDQTSCEYRTAQEVRMWPLEIAHAEYTSYVGDLRDVVLPGRARGALRLKVRATAGVNISDLALDDLTLFLRGAESLPFRLYELLQGHAIATVARPATRPAPWHHVVTESPVTRAGFEDEEALLPYGPRSFQGYRLLQEYFAFPQRYLFARLGGLAPAVRRCADTELELVVVTDAHDAELDGAVSAEALALNCTPAINLFPRRADRIHLSEAAPEYHVVADRTRPMDFEIYSVKNVVGTGAGEEILQTFRPFFAWNDRTVPGDHPAYYTLQRQPRAMSAKQRVHGARSSYIGSEVFISLVDADEGPFRGNLKQLSIEALCTNRDLPLHMTLRQGRTDFTLESGAPVESVRCLAGPTVPRPSHAHGDTSWRLISHLSLNYLSLVDSGPGAGEPGAALRELLSLYGDVADATTRKQIEGVRSTASAGVTRALPVPGPVTFGRGLEVTLTCDEASFEGAGLFLFGAVLDRFFAKYASINSFTETVLRSVQRGEIMRWPTRAGLRPIA
ncbi:MAG TPA: type VI secretion system baseplate subunit TssF [Polyangia bacterium]|jgi:type VI secretion system protein ImpG